MEDHSNEHRADIDSDVGRPLVSNRSDKLTSVKTMESMSHVEDAESDARNPVEKRDHLTMKSMTTNVHE